MVEYRLNEGDMRCFDLFFPTIGSRFLSCLVDMVVSTNLYYNPIYEIFPNSQLRVRRKD